MGNDTLFGKIIRGELPAKKVYEDDNILAIEDINPVAPVHLLIMPKKQYKSLQDVPISDLGIIGDIVQVAQKLARDLNITDEYRLLTNNGTKAGQSIFHLHFHLIGGAFLGGMA